MKLFPTAVLLWCLLLTGCIGENRDDCPPKNNLTLRFSYTNDDGEELFRERIQQTDLFLFDEAGYFVDRQIIGTDQLDANQSIALSLKPGTYRLVSWGHLLTRTGLSPLTPANTRFEDGYIFNNTLLGSTAETGDTWYYAPRASEEHAAGYFLTVPPSGTATQTIHFTSAHVRIELYIEKFPDPDGNGGNSLPLIEIDEHTTQLNFNKEAFGSAATYAQVSTHETIEGSQIATAYFNLPPFNNDNSIDIKIKRADGTVVTTVILKDYLTENNLSVENREEPVVPIYIKYTTTGGDLQDVNVSITVPQWDESTIKPGV